jgi:hypothetical protein
MLEPKTVPPSIDAIVSIPAVIDQILQLVASESSRLDHHLLGMTTVQGRSLAQLRAGPLGQSLTQLAMVANGQEHAPQGQVTAAIDTVLEVLFWPAGSDDYSVPRAFWETDLGRLLARAKFRAFQAGELVGIGMAAQQLGVSRPTVYRWMDDRVLDYVHDEISGRSFVLRHGLDRLRQTVPELQA